MYVDSGGILRISQFEAERPVRKDELFCRLKHVVFRFDGCERPSLLLRRHGSGFAQHRKLLLESSLRDDSYELITEASLSNLERRCGDPIV